MRSILNVRKEFENIQAKDDNFKKILNFWCNAKCKYMFLRIFKKFETEF